MNVGDLDKCVDCSGAGVIVATTLDGADFDRELARCATLPLEPSAYSPPGLTCRPCETRRLQSALPTRGVCPACGKENMRATIQGLSASRSFCDDRCMSAFLNR